MEATPFVHAHPQQLLAGERKLQEGLVGSGGAEHGAGGEILSTGLGWATLGIPDLAQLWRWWNSAGLGVLCVKQEHDAQTFHAYWKQIFP